MKREKCIKNTFLILFIAFLILTFLPFTPISFPSPETEAYFHFVVHETLSFTTKPNATNPQHIASTNLTYAIAEGFIRLSGVGGLSINNVLNIEIQMTLGRNSVNPTDHQVINNPTSVEIHTSYGFQPCNKVDVTNPPTPFTLTLTPSNNWHASGQVEFFISGTHPIDIKFNNTNVPIGNISTVTFKTENAIQIGDDTAYISKMNNSYVLAFTFLVIALMFLQLFIDTKGNSTENQAGYITGTEKVTRVNVSYTYNWDSPPKRRGKNNHWKK